jgi:uncharacterized membrane protein YeaQ/YmgE (transglycosylase-associated protein family)
MMVVVAWLLIGLAIGWFAQRHYRAAFPQAASTTLVAALAGGFLGGGLISLWASPGLDADAETIVASATGAFSLVAAVRWAGDPPEKRH